jgi:hypothetical protein
MRKFSAAMKALTDFSVLKEWITEQIDIDIPNADESTKVLII